ncbi:MAG: hypothetical protein PHX61_07600 [Alphaproteobacteria bacterium]|nr:hypothetical protein [Alphaproteobacteria bacterium]
MTEVIKRKCISRFLTFLGFLFILFHFHSSYAFDRELKEACSTIFEEGGDELENFLYTPCGQYFNGLVYGYGLGVRSIYFQVSNNHRESIVEGIIANRGECLASHLGLSNEEYIQRLAKSYLSFDTKHSQKDYESYQRDVLFSSISRLLSAERQDCNGWEDFFRDKANNNEPISDWDSATLFEKECSHSIEKNDAKTDYFSVSPCSFLINGIFSGLSAGSELALSFLNTDKKLSPYPLERKKCLVNDFVRISGHDDAVLTMARLYVEQRQEKGDFSESIAAVDFFKFLLALDDCSYAPTDMKVEK